MIKNYINLPDEEPCEEKDRDERLANEKIRESSVAEIKTKKGKRIKMLVKILLWVLYYLFYQLLYLLHL